MRSGATAAPSRSDVRAAPRVQQQQHEMQTLSRATSLYDVYPLTAAPRSSYDRAPHIARTRSQHDLDAALNGRDDRFHTSPSVGALFTDNNNNEANGSAAVDKRANGGRSGSLSSTFGKLPHEVYETKERSKVLSVLKRRGKAPGASTDTSTLHSAPAKFTADAVVCAGTLTKEGSWRRNWKSRFFILRRDCPSLCYYTSEDKLELLGHVPIVPDTIVLDKSSSGQAPYRFQVRTNAKTLLLEAETRATQREWIDAIQDLVDRVRADKFRASATALTRTSLMDRESSDSRSLAAAAASAASTLARRSSVPRAASVSTLPTASAPPVGHSAFSVDAVEYVAASVTSPTSGTNSSTLQSRPDGRDDSNPLFTTSSRGFFDDPSMDWDKLLEASSSSSWNGEASDVDNDLDDNNAFHHLIVSQRTLTASNALEPMAEDQVVDGSRQQQQQAATSSATAARDRSASHQITIVHRSPGAVVRRRRELYDLSIEVTLGRRCKLLRNDAASDRTGCFLRISGYLKQTKDLVDVGTTDAIKVATLVAAGERRASVPFTVVVNAELAQFAQLRFTLYKCSLNQSPGTAQACLGVGRCHVTDNFLRSIPKTINLLDKTTRESNQDAVPVRAPSTSVSSLLDPYATSMSVTSPTAATSSSTMDEVVAETRRGGAAMSFAPPPDGIQIAITAFPSLAPQEILATTGVDMASAKYLIPTTLSDSTMTDPTTNNSPTNDLVRTPPQRQNSARVLVDNSSFVAPADAVRFVAVDELLRVPRSTFALPLAYLDYVEEEVHERSQRLRKLLASRSSSHAHVALVEYELEHCRKKTEEYVKQRQFVMRQEKRLLDEQADGRVADAVRVLQKDKTKDSKTKDSRDSKDSRDGKDASDVVAPFKRSTYKSLDGWQFLPTNMQDQFLCAVQPGGAPPRVWHTMTMGCPAAHTKGFANGGYPHADMKPSEYNSVVLPAATPSSTGSNGSRYGGSNPATSPVNDALLDEPCTSPMGGPSAAASTQTEKTRRKSRVSGAKSGAYHHPTVDESLAALKTRLELKDRLDIIGSQILSAAVACVIATLDLAAAGSAAHIAQLMHAPRFGYLVNFESLLSTQGKELGMLEDFAAGAKWLRNVFVAFRKHAHTGAHFVIKNYSPADRRALAPGANTNENSSFDANSSADYSGTAHSNSGPSRSGHYLLVTIGVHEQHIAVLPPALQTGSPFRLRCVLFTQGVNEKQSLVHAYKASAVKVQERINRDNLDELRDLYAIYRRLYARSNSDSTLDTLLAQIEYHICSPANQFKKNVALLTDTSDFCRALGAARVTCCKSGKDRTAMSVTLEQARICMAELRATQSATLCASMRLYGVRRKNVFLNTKADKFAFNEVQRKMLPEAYKPPPGTYKSGKT